jgi:hypothetical protein
MTAAMEISDALEGLSLSEVARYAERYALLRSLHLDPAEYDRLLDKALAVRLAAASALRERETCDD